MVIHLRLPLSHYFHRSSLFDLRGNMILDFGLSPSNTSLEVAVPVALLISPAGHRRVSLSSMEELPLDDLAGRRAPLR